MSFAHRLRSSRIAKQLTQKDFAALADASEKSQIAYEAGKTPPTIAYLFRLAEHGIDVAYLLTGKRSDQPTDAEDARFLARFHQLGARERRAIERLVSDLAGGVPESGSAADMVDPDQLAAATGTVPPRLHSPRKSYKAPDA